MATTTNTTTKLGATLEVIAELAPSLRASGVLRVEVDGVVIDLLPEMPKGEPERNTKLRGEKDLFDDEDLYGGEVPSLRRREQ